MTAGWPTPTSKETAGGATTDPARVLQRAQGGHSNDLQDFVHLVAGWNTPIAADSRGSPGTKKHWELAQQVTGWATPLQRDHRTPIHHSYRDRGGGAKGEALNHQVAHYLPGASLSGSDARTGRRGLLNPDFSRWLQGIPETWPRFAPMVMPSIPSSQPTSSERGCRATTDAGDVMRKTLQVNDALLNRTWGSMSAVNQFFKRYESSLDALGLEAVKHTDRRFSVRLRAGGKNESTTSDSMSNVPSAAADDSSARAAGATNADDAFEQWATEVDVILQDDNEPPATEEQLHTLHSEGLSPNAAAQIVMDQRAQDLLQHHEIEPEEVKPSVVAQTIADQAIAPHADSPPTPAVQLVHLQLPQQFTMDEAAPIAHRIVRKAGVELVAVDSTTHQIIRTYSRADAHNA